jgi:hypothetical protein
MRDAGQRVASHTRVRPAAAPQPVTSIRSTSPGWVDLRFCVHPGHAHGAELDRIAGEQIPKGMASPFLEAKDVPRR